MSRPASARTLVLPALAGALVFANTVGNPLVYDDLWTQAQLDEITRVGWWQLLWSARGLTYVVHRLDLWLWSGAAAGLHLTNVLLHSIASLLAAWVGRRVSGSERTGLFCGLLFAVHPVHVEAVVSIGNRKDVLAAIFVFMALILWSRSREAPWRYSGALLCVLLGLLAKEVAAVGIVPMLFLSDLLPEEGTSPWLRLRSASARLLPPVLLGTLIALRLAGGIQERFDAAFIRQAIDPRIESYGQLVTTALASVPDQARLLFFPKTLSADYPTAPVTSLGSPRALAGAVILAAWIVCCVVLARSSPVAAFGATWTLVTYLPCSNLVPLTHIFVAERYLYVPSFGVCLLAALAFDRGLTAARRTRSAPLGPALGILFVVLFGALAVRSIARNADWRSAHALWSSAIRAGADSARARNNLGIAWFDRKQYTEAAREFREALRLSPGDATAALNLGNVLLVQGRFAEAEASFRRALSLEPDSDRAYYGLGVALGRQGEIEPAIEAERKALELNPGHADARAWLEALMARP